jgi:hypothetical protein
MAQVGDAVDQGFIASLSHPAETSLEQFTILEFLIR